MVNSTLSRALGEQECKSVWKYPIWVEKTVSKLLFHHFRKHTTELLRLKLLEDRALFKV